MERRVCVITGANRGLGFEAAHQLARRGYRVVVTARSRAKAEAACEKLGAEDLDVVPAELDVSSDDSVDAFAAWLGTHEGRVDVLVNNAGVIVETDGPPTSIAQVPAGPLLETLDTNTVGAYRVLHALMPMMKQAHYGRVVNVSSGMGALGDMGVGWPAYRISKAALNAVTCAFAAEAEPNIKINSVCPGWVRTDMGGQSADRSVEEGVRGIVWLATLPEDGPSGGFFRDQQEIAW